MRTTSLAVLALAALAVTASIAQQKSDFDAARIDSAINRSWPSAAPDWQARLVQDETMKECTQYRNSPPAKAADAIMARAKASIVYPADGKLVGEWKKGEALAQNGYGLRFTDTDTSRANGGNCYACHQINKAEVSYGTLGPSLAAYGKIRNFSDADTKAVYDKIYNSHAGFPCSTMPRFGTNRVLTVEQIKDIVALLMDRESPVNK